MFGTRERAYRTRLVAVDLVTALCKHCFMSSPKDTSLDLGIPQEDIDEVVDRIDLLELQVQTRTYTDEEAARILSSFETRLSRLNTELKDEAGNGIVSLRDECSATREVVAELNSEINVAVKGNV